MKSKNIGQKCVRTVSSHVFAGTFAKLNNNMILNENFLHSKNLVRLILAKFRLSFNDSQKQRFFNCNMNQLQDRLSHPTRVRGLKHLLQLMIINLYLVAPHTGAWIETKVVSTLIVGIGSHPTRVRGLKHQSKPNVFYCLCRTPHGCVD